MAETTPLKLRVSREEARQKIQARIEKGQQLRSEDIRSNETKKAGRERKDWSADNKILLLSLFGEESTAVAQYIHFDNFLDSRSLERFSPAVPYHVRRLRLYEERMNSSIKSLEEILSELALYDKTSNVQRTSANEDTSDNPIPTFGNRVFIIHGRDDGVRGDVALFVRDLGLKEIILDRQPNEGLIAILDKFEREAKKADFAIALLTPDDVGALKGEVGDQFKPRARQNVIFELGYFIKALGREKVCLLLKGEIENPSDLDGILYVSMNSPNGWRLPLATEMKQAGLPVDLNKLA